MRHVDADELIDIDAIAKQGYWIDKHAAYYECSECGEWTKKEEAYRYCPHCGAKMDGGEE